MFFFISNYLSFENHWKKKTLLIFVLLFSPWLEDSLFTTEEQIITCYTFGLKFLIGKEKIYVLKCGKI